MKARKNPGASYQKERVTTVTRVVGRNDTIIRRLSGDEIEYEIIVAGDNGIIGISGEFFHKGEPSSTGRNAIVVEIAEVPALIAALKLITENTH